MGSTVMLLSLGLSLLASAMALVQEAEANPIRKVVGLLQEMQKEVAAEGAKEKELFDKFMCFCGGNDAALKQKASELSMRIDELDAQVKRETAEKAQTTQELADHKSDREGAIQDLAQASTLRQKENGESTAFTADARTNLAAMAGAIPALEKGMGGGAGASLLELPSSLPTSVVKRLLQLAEAAPELSELDRRHLTGFLQQSSDYAPQGGQIVGILKTMEDEMNVNLKEAVAEEVSAVKAFADLKASKEQAISLAGQAIETKTVREGELAVSLVQAQDEGEDSQNELAEAEKFLANLQAQCKTKQAEWDARCKSRNDEIVAVGEAIKILNDDDALEVFKKTLPSASLLSESDSSGSLSFLQKTVSKTSMLRKAQAIVAGHHASSKSMRLLLLTLNSRIKLLESARGQGQGQGRARNFDKVIETVDKMVDLLGKDQVEDDKQREWCRQELDTSDDDTKRLERDLQGLSADIQEMGDKILTLGSEITSLEAGIKALDKEVAEGTEQRKEEHTEYTSQSQMNQAAKDLVLKAKNRLNKFYAPSQHVEESAAAALAQTGEDADPPKAPDTFSGDVQKNSKSGGVLAMMDQIASDIAKDMREAEYDEKDAQTNYNEFMQDSQESRAQDAKSITDKEGAKAHLQDQLDNANEKRGLTQDEHSTVQQYIRQLHSQCDFIAENYDVRKEARAKESDGLKQAKAMLSGAGF